MLNGLVKLNYILTWPGLDKSQDFKLNITNTPQHLRDFPLVGNSS